GGTKGDYDAPIIALISGSLASNAGDRLPCAIYLKRITAFSILSRAASSGCVAASAPIRARSARTTAPITSGGVSFFVCGKSPSTKSEQRRLTQSTAEVAAGTQRKNCIDYPLRTSATSAVDEFQSRRALPRPVQSQRTGVFEQEDRR